ncbi:nectin-2 isoform 2-T2 [Anomaloglossus baeobatrachus]|uniref:nectin-2 isoform X2 n=1 Tax=Anomaloglossus baeobatrachus TaxID=238106 RepID=UPI003F504764
MLLLCSLLGLLCSVLQAQDVSVSNRRTSNIGEDVTFSCTFSSTDPTVRVTQIMWMKGTAKLAVYNPQHGTYVEDPTHFQMVDQSENSATLKILRIRYTDEGEYLCEVTTFPGGNMKANTSMIVKATPQNSAEANTKVVAGDQEQVVATCNSVNGRPPARITWHATIPGNVSNNMVNNTDGTYTVVSQYLLTPTWTADGMPVTCIINYESTDYPIPLKLSVQYTPVVTIEGFDDNWHLHRNGVYLTCNGKGNPPPTSYIWKTADGSPLPASVRAKDNVLYVDEVDERVNRSFLCEVTNALGSRASRQDVLVREKPNSSGAGTTGGIIGGIIAGIVGIAVATTVIMICRQQRRNETAKDDEELDAPPAYKPPPPSLKLQTEQPSGEETLLTKLPQQPEITYHEEMTPPRFRQPHPRLHLDLENDYLEQENPIYNEFNPHDSESPREEQGFVMSPAVYV